MEMLYGRKSYKNQWTRRKMMLVERYSGNPIIKPEDVKPSKNDFEVICAFNAGVARLANEVVLLLRIAERPLNTNPKVYLSPVYDCSHNSIIIKKFDRDSPEFDFSDMRVIKTHEGNYLTSISHLRVARSKDGIHFNIEEKPSVFPSCIYEAYGIEDPRISQIDGTFYITYSAISWTGIVTCLMSTKDFRSFTRHGAIFHPDNKDVVIFPEKIHDRYYALHRPSISHFGKPDIWIAESPDLICWGNHRYLMGTRGGYWDNGRIGGSAIPFKIKEGWLEIYHGATKDDRYCLGAVLLDADEPWKIIARSVKPIMEPQSDYEINGFFGNVIFSCGVLYENNKVKIYYGAADTFMAYAEIQLDEILKSLE
jgi:beta-1,2-mannobiose phosphorylase / 1,2-beta-oligomannan phosphorylase